MTQTKSNVKPVADLRGKFLALDTNDQQRVTTFFNLHNAAMFAFQQMSDEAKEYTTYNIQLASEGLEKENE